MSDTDDQAWLDVMLQRNGYPAGKLLPGGRYTCVQPKLYTHAILVGRIGWDDEYDDWWCYETRLAAVAAMNVWDGEGEPIGWIRHARTGRRISDDPDTLDEHGEKVPVGQMYVNP